MWQKILENAEDNRASTVITSIYCSKAFNRMSFQHCLAALARNGASTQVLQLVATFLTNRTMAVKVGSIESEARPVNGGCPQSSILGVLLFNSTIDDLEEGCDDLVQTKDRIPGSMRQPRNTQRSLDRRLSCQRRSEEWIWSFACRKEKEEKKDPTFILHL